MTVTHIAAAAGGLAWLLIEWRLEGRPKALGTVTGAIAGLATVTPTAGFVGARARRSSSARAARRCACSPNACCGAR